MLEVPRGSETVSAVPSKSTAASMASTAPATWVPVSWGQGVVPASGEELVSHSATTSTIGAAGATGDDMGVIVGASSVIGDFDEEMPSWDDGEMEPFDAERFVDRLVEDDPPSWRGDAQAGGAGKVWEAAKPSGGSSSSANLFLWPSQPLLGGYEANPQQQQQQQSQDVPMVVPHDPILDALFTPCRVMMVENSQPAVTFGLVRVSPGFCPGGEKGGGGGSKRSIMGFEPVPVYNIPPPAEAYTASLQVPMAPLRQPSGGRFGVGLYSPPGSTSTGQGIQSAHRLATYLNENSNNVPVEHADATTTAAAAAPLTGADAHSSQEYDDERHAFLRKQEAAVFVEPTKLSRLLAPAERAAAVDWLRGLHAAAPAASGGGGEPLSLETLFLAVNLMDRFLSTPEGARTVCGGGGSPGAPSPELKLVAAACLALSSKYQDTQAATLWGLAVASISGTSPTSTPLHLGGVGGDGGGGGVRFGSNRGGGGDGGGDVFGVLGAGDGEVRAARKELVAMEMRVASALGFRLTVPSAISFLGVFLRRAGALGYLRADSPSSERVREEAQQILLCVLRDACSLAHPPSALAAAALYWASCVTSPGAAPPTLFAFLAVTGYELEQLCRCLRDMEGVRTGGGGGGGGRGRHWSGSRSFYLPSSGTGTGTGTGGGGGGGGGRGDSLFGGAAFPEHAGHSLFGAGGGHPAIAAL